MKKSAFLALCLATLFAAGCDDSSSASGSTICTEGGSECQKGTCSDGVCICETGYYIDKEGHCTSTTPLPDEDNDNNNNNNNNNNNGANCVSSCDYVFSVSNPAASGKQVVVTGEFDQWGKSANVLTEDNGVFKGTVKLQDNQTYKYKYYIIGESDETGWFADETAQFADDGNNVVTVKCNSDAACYSGGSSSGNNNNNNTSGECITTFSYYNEAANAENYVSGVYLVGNFNEWKEQDPDYLMTSDGNGKWSIDVKWPQGSSYEYKYIVFDWAEDKWKTDAADGSSNGVANISSCGLCFGNGCAGGGNTGGGGNTSGGNSTIAPTDPNAQLQGIKVEGMNITITFKDTPSEIVSGGVNPSLSGNTLTDTVTKNSKYTYRVKVGDQEVYVPVWVESESFDWHDAVLYFAFTDRFVNGNTGNDKKSGTWDNSSATDWYGGDFAGMKQKVDEGYFDALGINTLWISSVTKNTEATSAGTNGDTHNYSAYHSYWPVCAFRTDYNASEFGSLPAIEDHFGTIEELRALVDSCHEHGIRVLVDFAANQVFKDSPMYEKHKDWFNDVGSPVICDDNNGWGWDNYSEKCWFSADLPDINYENAEARKTMVDHAIWIIKETNIDGFRVDAVKHMNIQFIKDLRYAVDQLFTNTGTMFYMVGETFTGDKNLLNKYIGNDLLHAQFDFPLYYMIGNVLRGNGLYQAIHEGQTGYKANFNSDLMGTFMGNHDVARAISVAAKQNENKWGNNDTPTSWEPYDRLMAAWMILLTQPGVPLIYYGDEFGMPGSNDPDNRRMMLFGDSLNEQQKGTLDFVQKLVNIRRQHKALSRGERELLNLPQGTSDNSTACYKMTYDGETVIVGIGLPDGSGHTPGKCSLGTTYNLVNLFDNTETSTNELDLSGNKFQVWLVK